MFVWCKLALSAIYLLWVYLESEKYFVFLSNPSPSPNPQIGLGFNNLQLTRTFRTGSSQVTYGVIEVSKVSTDSQLGSLFLTSFWVNYLCKSSIYGMNDLCFTCLCIMLSQAYYVSMKGLLCIVPPNNTCINGPNTIIQNTLLITEFSEIDMLFARIFLQSKDKFH